MKDLSLHILDIVQNAITAGALIIRIRIDNSVNPEYRIDIEDNGSGMSEETLKQVTDPYYTSRTSRNVGLGLPLLKHNAESTGGTFSIISSIKIGTKVITLFRTDHVDCPPEGDISGTIALLATANPEIDFYLEYSTVKGSFRVNTFDIKEILGGLRISDPLVYPYLKTLMEENLHPLQMEFKAKIA